MLRKLHPSAFTVSYPRKLITKEIRLPVKIGNPGDSVKKALKFEAIWDTGTTMSMISTAVLIGLDLTDIIDTIAVTSVGGKEDADAYFVDVWLPGSMHFPDIPVAHQEKLKSCDLLIGMDIIGKGDSCITTFANHTTLTFRHPSCCQIDFAKEINDATRPSL